MIELLSFFSDSFKGSLVSLEVDELLEMVFRIYTAKPFNGVLVWGRLKQNKTFCFSGFCILYLIMSQGKNHYHYYGY